MKEVDSVTEIVKRKRGRPKGTTGIKKTKLKPDALRLNRHTTQTWTLAQLHRLQDALAISGECLTDLVRDGALARAEAIIAQHHAAVAHYDA